MKHSNAISRARLVLLGIIITVAVIAGLVPWRLVAQDVAQFSTAQVMEKIEGLGKRDDTLSYQEQPLNWLKLRRDQVLERVVKGLDHTNSVVAMNCLVVLRGAPATEPLVEGLLRVAEDHKHLLSRDATLRLAAYGGSEGVDVALVRALGDDARFPDPEKRARFAEALGRQQEETALLGRCLGEILVGERPDYSFRGLVKRLVAASHKDGVAILEKFTLGPSWGKAASSYLGMALLDPAGHGLTGAQKELMSTRLVGKGEFDVAQHAMGQAGRIASGRATALCPADAAHRGCVVPCHRDSENLEGERSLAAVATDDGGEARLADSGCGCGLSRNRGNRSGHRYCGINRAVGAFCQRPSGSWSCIG